MSNDRRTRPKKKSQSRHVHSQSQWAEQFDSPSLFGTHNASYGRARVGDHQLLINTLVEKVAAVEPEPTIKASNITCTVCLEIFTDPKILPCCHTFCLKCLTKMGSQTTTKQLKCPQCRAEHKVPDSGPSGFLSDFSLAPEIAASKTSKQDPKPHTCEQCDELDPAVSFCKDCHSFLCDSCSQAHQRMKLFKQHSVCTLECLRESDLPAQPIDHNLFVCSSHPKEEPKLFCKTCQFLVCCICIVNEHKGHDLSEIDTDARKIIEDEVTKLLSEAERKIKQSEENLEYVMKVERKVQKRPDKLKAEIKKAFNPLIAALQEKQATLIAEAENTSSADMKELWSQKEYLETTLAGLKSSHRYAQRLMQANKDHPKMMLHSRNLFVTRFKEMEKRKWDGISTREVETTSLTFFQNDLPTLGNLKRAGQLKADVTPMCATDLNLKIEVPQPAELGQEVTFVLRCKSYSPRARRYLSENHLAVSIYHGRSQTKYSLFYSGMCYPIVKKNPDLDSLTVTFIPVVSGRHVIKLQTAAQENPDLFVQDNSDFFVEDWDLQDNSDLIAQANADLIIHVTGVPSNGQNVTYGPDWNDDPLAQRQGQLQLANNIGTVSSVYGETNNKVVKVTWSQNYHQGGYYNYSSRSSDVRTLCADHNWGAGEEYPIQLSMTV